MRNKKIILLSYCCLNQNSVIIDWERARGAYPFVDILRKEGFGIIQLPCPELLSKGMDRPALEYEDYDEQDHRNLCKRLINQTMETIDAHRDGGDKIVGLIGVKSSPNCSITGQRGVFMEELFDEFANKNMEIDYIEVPEDYCEGDLEVDFNQELLHWLGEFLE